MPLASSRHASQKRAEAVAAEKKERERRQRLSLPASIKSTTHVNEAKAKRRLSRRLSAHLTISSKENGAPNKKSNAASPESPRLGPTPYYKIVEERGGQKSPPLTRSHKKESRKDPTEFRGGGMVLNFSPPNQEENARRELARMDASERERARRIRQARKNGQLLVFSPSNRPIDLEDDRTTSKSSLDPSPSGQELNMDDNNSTAASAMTESHNMASIINEQMMNEMKGLKQDMQVLLQSKNSQSEEHLNKTALQKEQLRTEMMAEANRKLEKANESIQLEVKDLTMRLETEKSTYLVDTTRLQSQLDAAYSDSTKRVKSLETERDKLEAMLLTLQSEKLELVKCTTKLENEAAASVSKLHEAKDMLDALRQQNASEKESLLEDTRRLEQVNACLSREMDSVKKGRDRLEHTIAAYEKKIYDLEHCLLPESESRREDALHQLAEREEQILALQLELQKFEVEVAKLKSDIGKLRLDNEKERNSFQLLNEDSCKAYERMREEIGQKDSKIGELFKQLGDMQQQLDREICKSDELSDDLQKAKETMEKSSHELNSALKETVNRLEESEQEKVSLRIKLTDALEHIESAGAAKIEAESKTSETASALAELEEALKEERESAMLARTRAEEATSRAEQMEKETRERLLHVQELEKELKVTVEERDDARCNMLGFSERENELYHKLRESDRIRRDLHGRVMQLMGNIRVFVRVRPPLPEEVENEVRLVEESVSSASLTDRKKRKRETLKSEGSLFRFPGIYEREEKKVLATSASDDVTKNIIEVTEPFKERGGLSDRRKKWRFAFDSVFSPKHGQDDVWEATEPLIQSAVDGYNVTIFAYGQTGSGKTYTMLGHPGSEGIISRSVRKLFDTKREMESLSRSATTVEMSVELLEVYNEQVRDLLAPNAGLNGREISLKVTSQEVVGNLCVSASTEDEVMKVLALAQSRRCVKATSSNSQSSRSHMLFTIHFAVTTKNGIQRKGKLNVCDLAGSERLDKSGANTVGGALLLETQNINKSLSTLSNVIERLQSGSGNVPFRESKLTFLLQNSLGGNSKTLAIVCCNPLPSHFHESVCSLRFAEKVNKVDLKKAVANFSC
jgi:kinesin family protein C1